MTLQLLNINPMVKRIGRNKVIHIFYDTVFNYMGTGYETVLKLIDK